MAINDPRDIPGLVAWYSAEAETGYADGAVVTQWTDLSGNGNHAPATDPGVTWSATAGPSGGPCLRFAGQGYFSLPSASGWAGGTIAAQIKAGATGSPHWSFTTNETGYPRTDDSTQVYESFGISGRYTFTHGVTLTAWHRYAALAGTSLSAYIDGVSKYTIAIAKTFNTRTPRLGASETALFSGDMACVVLYGRALTTTERTDLDAWMVAHPNGGTAAAQQPTGTLAGSLSKITGTLAGSYTPPPVTGSLAGNLSALTGSFAGQDPNVATPATLTGTLSALTGLFAGSVLAAPVETSTEFANYGYGYTGRAEVDHEPPIAVSPARIRPAKIRRVHQSIPAPTLVDGRPV